MFLLRNILTPKIFRGSSTRFLIKIAIILAVAFAFLFSFSHYVPFNMDEFSQYHNLSCYNYPLNRLNTFRESCDGYDLSVGGSRYLPLRSYIYTGSFPSLVYYPLFKIWPSPYSARFLGLLLLMIQAYLIYKIFKIDFVLSFLILLAAMPYAFQHIVDTGPIALQTTSVFLIAYLAKKWPTALKNNAKNAWIYPLLGGSIIFLGIWIKLAYFFVLPGVLILFFNYFLTQKNLLAIFKRFLTKRFFLHLGIFFFVAVVPSIILLSAFDRKGVPYYQTIGNYHSTNFPKSNTRLENVWELFKYFLNPLASSHRVFLIETLPTIYGVLLAIAVCSFVTIGFIYLHRKRTPLKFAVLNIALFFMTFGLVVLSEESWAMHHVVLSFPFLILVLFYLYSQWKNSRVRMVFLVFFFLVNIFLYWQLICLTPRAECHPSISKINTFLNDNYTDSHIFIVVDWGVYYLKALYGNDNQSVLYTQPLNNVSGILEIKDTLSETGRKALFISRINSNSDLSLIKQYFPNLVLLKTNFDKGSWQILYEP